MTNSLLRLWAPVLALFLLTACETTPRKATGGALQESHLYTIDTWSAEGKISLQMGNERETASFNWSQEHDNYSVHLFGPFGQGATWLRKTPSGVTLENAKTGVHRAKTAEALMKEVLGWQVPVSNLQFWLRGLPAKRPKPSYLQRDEAGLITELRQEGWEVAYSKHQFFAGWWLPGKIVAQHGELRLTIALKNWRLPPSPIQAP